MVTLIAAALAAPAVLLGQSVEPRVPASSSPGCVFTPAPANAETDPVHALELLRRGQQAALAGDRLSARELLAGAVRLDPTNADAAYHHARLLEELGESGAARTEYCRFLSLPVTSVDSAEVTARLGALPIGGPTAPHDAAEALARGAEYLARDDPRSAARAFTYVVLRHPEVAESYLNRAIAQERMGRRGGAIRDYRAYLNIAPNAEDRAQVEAHLAQLAGDVASPGSAFGIGLVVPGWGQFATQRPGFGLVVLAGVGGSAFLATRKDVVTRTGFFEHPFSPEESYTYEYQERVHPYLVAGIATGAALTIAAAVEAFLHAQSLQSAALGDHRARAQGARVGPYLAADPRADRLSVGLRVKLAR